MNLLFSFIKSFYKFQFIYKYKNGDDRIVSRKNKEERKVIRLNYSNFLYIYLFSKLLITLLISFWMPKTINKMKNNNIF